MKIKIYQVNLDRDEHTAAFRGLYDKPMTEAGAPVIDSSIYDSVFEGEINCESLEDVFRMFNINHPEGYRARSLSVSDVVEVTGSDKLKDGFYFCDNIGFNEVVFDPTATKQSELFLKLEPANKITVLLVEPNKYPKFIEIEDSLEAMQRAVGGDIEEYMPFSDEVAIICNEEGKINGEPYNRAIYSEAPEEEMTYEEGLEHAIPDEEMTSRFREVERSGGNSVVGFIVFSADSFDKEYPEAARTYAVSSNNKAFMPNMGGYSIYGSSLDGSDRNVRLERYMAKEHGGKDGWKIERCYMKDDSKKQMLDVIAGKFFVCYAPIESETFQSLPKDLAQKYERMFKYPETFVRTQNGITAVPFKPKSKEMER